MRKQVLTGLCIYASLASANKEVVVMQSFSGIPELAHLVDTIHEGLPSAEAAGWQLQFAGAVCPGVDLADVPRRALVRVLREIVMPVAGSAAAQQAVERAAAGLESGWADDTPSAASAAAAAAADAAVTRAATAAARAAEDAASAAAEAAAWVAEEAAEAVASAAEATAWAAGLPPAERARAEAEAGADAYVRIADILVNEMLGAALPPA
jgi:hypothetical protein